MGEPMSDTERPCGDPLRIPRYCRRRAVALISSRLLLGMFERGLHEPYLITSGDQPIPDDAILVGWSHTVDLDGGRINVVELTIHSHTLDEVEEGADPPQMPATCALWIDLNRVRAALLPRTK